MRFLMLYITEELTSDLAVKAIRTHITQDTTYIFIMSSFRPLRTN